MKVRTFVVYFFLLHLCLVYLLLKTDKIQSIFNPPLEFNKTYYTTAAFLKRMDNNLTKGTIFIGDSFIQGLAVSEVVEDAVNFGIGGDTTLGVKNRITDYSSLESAEAIVLSVGLNDFRYRNDEQIEKNFASLINVFTKKAPLIVNSIFPVDESLDISFVNNRRIKDTNNVIENLCRQFSNCTFLSVFNIVLNSNGELSKQFYLDDGIHLNGAGYQLWIDQLNKVLVSNK